MNTPDSRMAEFLLAVEEVQKIPGGNFIRKCDIGKGMVEVPVPEWNYGYMRTIIETLEQQGVEDNLQHRNKALLTALAGILLKELDRNKELPRFVQRGNL